MNLTSGACTMPCLSPACLLGYTPSPQHAFQGDAAHQGQRRPSLTPNDSPGTWYTRRDSGSSWTLHPFHRTVFTAHTWSAPSGPPGCGATEQRCAWHQRMWSYRHLPPRDLLGRASYTRASILLWYTDAGDHGRPVQAHGGRSWGVRLVALHARGYASGDNGKAGGHWGCIGCIERRYDTTMETTL